MIGNNYLITSFNSASEGNKKLKRSFSSRNIAALTFRTKLGLNCTDLRVR
jgi:hypothetical protein